MLVWTYCKLARVSTSILPISTVEQSRIPIWKMGKPLYNIIESLSSHVCVKKQHLR